MIKNLCFLAILFLLADAFIETPEQKLESVRSTICQTTGWLIKKHYLLGMDGLRKSGSCEFINNASNYDGNMIVSGYIEHKNAQQALRYSASITYNQGTDTVRLLDVDFKGDLRSFVLDVVR